MRSELEFANSLGVLVARKQSHVVALESRLKLFQRVLDLKRSYRTLMGVKEVRRPTYEIDADLPRFNQKYNLTIGRPSWDPLFGRTFAMTTIDNANTLADRGMAGYTIFDRALVDGARTMSSSFDTNINCPNSGFLSWSFLKKPIAEPSILSAEMKGIQAFDQERMTNLIKKVALWFGASLVGVALLDRRWVYSRWYDNRSSPHRNPRIVFSDETGYEQYLRPSQLEDGTQVIPKEIRWVISLGFEMDYESTQTAPAPISYAGTFMCGYRKIVQTVASLAEFIRGLGFCAIPSSNDTALSVPIAIDAGLGEDARLGGMLTPEYGPRVRLAKVLTDLPLTADKPITFGIHEFCDNCKKCAKGCPGRAIPYGPRTDGTEKNDVEAPTTSESVGALRWIRNGERCREYWQVVATNCGVCVRVCPWNKPAGALHSLSKWLAINGGWPARRALTELDDILRYGRQMKPEEWWGEPHYWSS